MKRCPQCGTTYTDATLRFCLADGTALVGGEEPLRAEIPSPDTRVSMGSAQHPPRTSKAWIFVVLGTVIIGLMAIAGVVVLGILAYIGSVDAEPEQIVFATPSPAAAPSEPASDEQILRQELEKLEKQLEDMDLPRVDQDPFPDGIDTEAGAPMTATANSPKDGFLALRSLPSTDIGERLAVIPHGAEVKVVACDPNYNTLNGRRGRWCLLMWGQFVGWAFDAYLTF